MRARRAQARLRRRDARAPRDANLPLQALYRRGLSFEFRRSGEHSNLGDAGKANQARHPKSSANSRQRIPSPFMGEG